MNPLSSRNEGRFSWKKFAAFAGLLCVAVLAVLAVLAVFQPVDLARLTEAAPAEARDARLDALAARVAELVQETEAFRKRPEAMPLARYDAERQAVEQRLTAIEQVLSERSDDGSLLRDRLARLEDEWAQHTANAATESVNPPAPPAAPVPPPAPPPPAPPPRIAEPSFRVIGVERRAEERFVAILPKGTEVLSEARLLRVGEQENGWRLDAIEEDAGVFSQGGRKRRLSLPGGKP
jgi:hypothetical protein